MSAPNCYAVLAPMHWTEVVLEDGSGPSYSGDAVLFVRTRDRRNARRLAVRAWRRKARSRQLRSDERPDFIQDPGIHPYAGVRVENYDALENPE